MSRGFTTLDQIVNYTINELSLSDSDYYRLYMLALREYKEINRRYSGEYKEVSISLCANGTAVIPDEVQKVISVGLINSRGEFFGLRKNKRVSRNLEEDCDRLTQATVGPPAVPFTNGGANISPYPNSYVYSMGSLGVGSDTNFGTYDVDYDAGLILFDFQINQASYGNIVLRYLPVLGCCDGEILVPEVLEDTLIKYLIYRTYIHNRNVSGGDKQLYKQEYNNSSRLAKQQIRKVNFAEIISSYRRNLRSSIKV